MKAGTSALICGVMFGFLLSFTSADQKNITAESGQKNVTLTCQAPNNIILVEWRRADLDPQDVISFRKNYFVPVRQHPTFKNRVDLQDRQMKDGDVSLILKNVTINDTGTYECHTFMEKTKSWENISIIHLIVDPPGQTGGHTEDGGKDGGSVGLIIGLLVSAALLVAVVGFLVYRKHKQKQDSYQPPPEQHPA